jgi:hypothetical protein
VSYSYSLFAHTAAMQKNVTVVEHGSWGDAKELSGAFETNADQQDHEDIKRAYGTLSLTMLSTFRMLFCENTSCLVDNSVSTLRATLYTDT